MFHESSLLVGYSEDWEVRPENQSVQRVASTRHQNVISRFSAVATSTALVKPTCSLSTVHETSGIKHQVSEVPIEANVRMHICSEWSQQSLSCERERRRQYLTMSMWIQSGGATISKRPPGGTVIEPAKSGSHPNLILAICCMSLLIVGMDATIVNVALPAIQKDLHARLAGLQWILDAYTLVVASFLMLAGSTSDRIGRLRVFQVG
jgi:hypothetical protein